VKVRGRRERIAATGAVVVIVVHDEAARVRSGLLRDLAPPGPVLVDAEAASYGRWGLRRGSLRDVYHPRALFRWARLAVRDGASALPGRDTLQLGGDFVIDPGGRVAFAAPQRQSDVRPPVGLLLGELERAGRDAGARARHRPGSGGTAG
jgi:hypothetical protein